MTKRKPLGIPLDRHRKISSGLLELDRLSQQPGAPLGMKKLCNAIRYHMDEYIHMEFPELDFLEKCKIYYPGIKIRLQDCDSDHGLAALDEIIGALNDDDPQSRALPIARQLSETTLLLTCQQTDPEPPGHRRRRRNA